jgi:hypothetical protein
MFALSLTRAQQEFTATLSAVEDAVHYAFSGRLRPQEYEEALAEAKAAAWCAWNGLLKRGKDPLVVGVHGIARNAVRWVRARRKVGNRSSGRGSMDIQHPRVRRDLGLRVVSFSELAWPQVGSWRDWLAEDNSISPADEAIFHLDYEAWLAGLAEPKRRVAELLAVGHEPGLVARLVGVSPARVSQLRHELEASWREFQAPASVHEADDSRTARV